MTRVVSLRNTGASTLSIIGISLSNELSSQEFALNHDPLTLQIPVGEERELEVVYSPQNLGLDEGSILIESNSSTGRETRVRVRTNEGATELLYPSRSVFSLSPCEDELVREVEFVNLGTVQVEITDVSLSAGSARSFEVVSERLIKSDGTELMEGAPGARTIGQGDKLAVSVKYTRSELRGEDQATLELAYSGDNGEPYRVNLVGAELEPAVEIAPIAVEFGAQDLNEETDVREVVLINRGISPLNIESINLAVNDPTLNAQFTLHDVEVPQTLETDQEVRFGVSYTPAMSGAHRTAISVNFGACEGQVSIPVSGRLREPCLQVSPEQVSFGRVAQSQSSAPSALELLNCGDTEVEITEVDLATAGSDFTWQWREQGVSLPFTLSPRMTKSIEVSYTNNRLAEGQPDTNTLYVLNDTPNASRLEVPLSVAGGGVPSCDLRVIPERMNFGLVSRGRSVTRELRALNVGTGRCEIRNQEITSPFGLIPLPGFDTVKFTLTQPIQGNEALAGQFMPFEITYTPDVFNSDLANYQLTYFDPFTMQEKVATAELSGVAGESNIEVIPSRLDFGAVTAGECASREERVTVYNTGLVDLCITGMEFEGAGCGEFFIVDRPVADADGCIVVTRNRPAEVSLVYEPGALGADECNLVFISDAADAPELRVPLEGEGVASSSTVDEFVQTSGQTVDVLFVIDNSGSMGEEQDNLQDNFAEFINGAQQFNNDYQIGIVTTDMEDESEAGRLQGSPRIMRRGAGIESQFRNAVDVGTSGSGTEKGLEAARSALSDPLAFDTGVTCQSDSDCVEPDMCVEGTCGGLNRGFVREGAALEVIFVSDEDDFSDASLNFYVDFLKNIKGFRNESLFHANAIVGSNNGRAASCSGAGGDASAGERYVEVANRTNGRVFSICEEDFGTPLQEIGNRAFGLPVQFFLSRPAARDTIEVEVQSQPRPSGWSYDAPSNSVVFEDTTVPQPGQTVRVEYEAQCFPRRN